MSLQHPLLHLEEELRCLMDCQRQVMADRSMDQDERRAMLSELNVSIAQTRRGMEILRTHHQIATSTVFPQVNGHHS